MAKGNGKKDEKESFLTKKQLKQALTKFGADQEQRLTDRLQAISNQVNMTLSGTKSVLSDHAVRINALTDFACANLAELVVVFDDLTEKIAQDTVEVPDTDKLRAKIRERITSFQTELKAYQERAKKQMAEMVHKAQKAIKPPEAEEPKIRRIDLSDELPMDESLKMGPGKAE